MRKHKEITSVSVCSVKVAKKIEDVSIKRSIITLAPTSTTTLLFGVLATRLVCNVISDIDFSIDWQ
jgi:hypothetical protein